VLDIKETLNYSNILIEQLIPKLEVKSTNLIGDTIYV
jgi:hypothetical protein